jgi:hypothetical protein
MKLNNFVTKKILIKLQNFGHKVSKSSQRLFENPNAANLKEFVEIRTKYEEETKHFFDILVKNATTSLEKEINEIDINDISGISDDSILKIFSISKEAVSVTSRENKPRSGVVEYEVVNNTDTRNPSQMYQIRIFSSYIAKSSKPRKYDPNKVRASRTGKHSTPKQLMDQCVADYRRTFYNIGLESSVSEELISRLISVLKISWYDMSKPGRKVYAAKEVSEATKTAVKDLILKKP